MLFNRARPTAPTPARYSALCVTGIAWVKWVVFAAALGVPHACGDPEGEKPRPYPGYDVSPYVGTYRVSPSFRDTRLILRADGSLEMTRLVAGTDGGRPRLETRSGFFQVDKEMLRIYISEGEEASPQAVGLFLLRAFNTSAWDGRWRGETRALVRITSSPSER